MKKDRRLRICHTPATRMTSVWKIVNHMILELMSSLSSLNFASFSLEYSCPFSTSCSRVTICVEMSFRWWISSLLTILSWDKLSSVVSNFREKRDFFADPNQPPEGEVTQMRWGPWIWEVNENFPGPRTVLVRSSRAFGSFTFRETPDASGASAGGGSMRLYSARITEPAVKSMTKHFSEPSNR